MTDTPILAPDLDAATISALHQRQELVTFHQQVQSQLTASNEQLKYLDAYLDAKLEGTGFDRNGELPDPPPPPGADRATRRRHARKAGKKKPAKKVAKKAAATKATADAQAKLQAGS